LSRNEDIHNKIKEMSVTFFFNLFLIQIAFTTISGITYSCQSNSICGCSFKSAVVTKIIGGEQAGIDTWGWAVSIRVRNNHVCGGSLISSTLVLTAAHCLSSINTISSLSINAGSEDVYSLKHRRSISEMYIHRNYNGNTYINDIAVLRLSSPLNINDHSLAVICLPLATTVEYPPKDTAVVAIGWGILAMRDKVSSRTLQQVTLKTIAQTADKCQQSIYDGNIQFCAGVQGGGKGIEKS
jgi:trypsin